MDKYYTPELEEFYYGFKYYYREYEKSKYVDCIFGDINDTDLNDIIEEINDGKVKVKYLDKEDIESLGFNQISDDCFNMSNINYRGLINCDLRILIRKTALIYLIEPDEISHTLFTGNIKNKSELKKLLKQLGIG